MGATILIADDLSFMRMIQKEILTERGYTIVGEAVDGREAVEKFKTFTRTSCSWTSPCQT